MSTRPPVTITGRHVLGIMLLFFGVVIAVNFAMAYLATSSFAGLVVQNSYVESQRFNEKLAAMRRQADLGWNVALDVAADGVRVSAHDRSGRPLDFDVSVEMTRPTTDDDDHRLDGRSETAGLARLPTHLKSGTWDADAVLRLADGTTYRASRRVTLPATQEPAR